MAKEFEEGTSGSSKGSYTVTKLVQGYYASQFQHHGCRQDSAKMVWDL